MLNLLVPLIYIYLAILLKTICFFLFLILNVYLILITHIIIVIIYFHTFELNVVLQSYKVKTTTIKINIYGCLM